MIEILIYLLGWFALACVVALILGKIFHEYNKENDDE